MCNMCLQGPENVLLIHVDFSIVLDCGHGALPSCVSEQVVAPVSLWPSASELRSDGRGKCMWRQPVAFWRFQLCNTTSAWSRLAKTEGTLTAKPGGCQSQSPPILCEKLQPHMQTYRSFSLDSTPSMFWGPFIKAWWPQTHLQMLQELFVE